MLKTAYCCTLSMSKSQLTLAILTAFNAQSILTVSLKRSTLKVQRKKHRLQFAGLYFVVTTAVSGGPRCTHHCAHSNLVKPEGVVQVTYPRLARKC
jgi:hypothetical protein